MNQREIKFRAWDKTNKEFIPEIFFMDYKGNLTQVDTGKELVDLPPDFEFILQQYTGKNDKDGEGIFEGDVVEDFNCAIDDKARNLTIEFREDEACFAFKEIPNSAFFPVYAKYCRIIGNIYETPGLITPTEP